MNRSDRLTQWIFEWISVTAEGLGILRIFTALFILFFLIPGEGSSHFAWLATISPDFYAPPPGPMMLFENFAPYPVYQIVHTVLILSLLAMLFGYHTKPASIAAGIAILILQGIIFSVGKINHEILVALVPIVMAFSNWGLRFSIDSRRKKDKAANPESWPVVLLAVFTGFMMFTAGFPKILGGWLDPSAQASYGHLLNQFFVKERQALMAETFVNIQAPFLWEMLDWATVLFEVGFLASVYKAKWFRLFVGIAVIFHFSTLMTLNIAFLPNFLAYAVFLNWNGIYEGMRSLYIKFSGKSGPLSETRPVLLASLAIGLLFLILKRISGMDVLLADSELSLYEVVLLAAALTVVLYLGSIRLLRIKKVK